MKVANLLGVPLDLGAKNLGVDIGPNAFRYQNIVEKLSGSGLEMVDLGNLVTGDRSKLRVGNKKLRYLDEITKVSQQSAKLSFKHVKKGEKMVILGGDHSVCLGVISGASDALKGDLGLIYLDAHGDMNTDKTTLTGNIHGMHLASLLGFGNEGLVDIHSNGAKIAIKNLLHIGGNDFDRAEVELIRSENLICFRIIDLLSGGMGPLLGLIDKLRSQVNNIWVSLDLDVIDSIYAPGAGMPNKAGLSYREITTICGYIGRECNVIGLDIVEYNPLHDIENKTAELGIELIAKLLGCEYGWYAGYMKNNSLEVGK